MPDSLQYLNIFNQVDAPVAKPKLPAHPQHVSSTLVAQPKPRHEEPAPVVSPCHNCVQQLEDVKALIKNTTVVVQEMSKLAVEVEDLRSKLKLRASLDELLHDSTFTPTQQNRRLPEPVSPLPLAIDYSFSN